MFKGHLHKIKSLLTSVVFFLLLSCTYKEVSIHEAIKLGNIVVGALETHKQDKGDYPKNLSDLVPRYLDEIPKTGLDGSENFHYNSSLYNERKEVIYDYRILFYTDKIRLLSDKSAKRCVYVPSQEYTKTKNAITHEIIDGWACQTVYRQYRR